MIAAVGAEVDRLEAIIRKAMPSIRHIDLVCLVKHSCNVNKKWWCN